MDKKISQKEKVLKHMEKNNTITSIEAFEIYKITRLSSIINILRKEGYDIESRKPKKGNYSIYHLWGTKYQTHHIDKREKNKQEKKPPMEIKQTGLGFEIKFNKEWPD